MSTNIYSITALGLLSLYITPPHHFANCFFCCFFIAVQSERKPIDIVPREKHVNCAASTQKIYIRKDLNSPLIATPTFISDTEADGSRSVEIRATTKAQLRS